MCYNAVSFISILCFTKDEEVAESKKLTNFTKTATEEAPHQNF